MKQDKTQFVEYADLSGQEVQLRIVVPDWVLEDIERIEALIPDPVKGHEAAKRVVDIFNTAFTLGLTMEADTPKLAIMEAMAMFDGEVESEPDR
jgi:hypothetical protein